MCSRRSEPHDSDWSSNARPPPAHPASGTTTTSTCSRMALMKAAAAPVGMSWMWTLAFGHHEDRTPMRGYEATREAAMAAFAKSWWRNPLGLPAPASARALAAHARRRIVRPMVERLPYPGSEQQAAQPSATTKVLERASFSVAAHALGPVLAVLTSDGLVALNLRIRPSTA
jgi:hypothetical protein